MGARLPCRGALSKRLSRQWSPGAPESGIARACSEAEVRGANDALRAADVGAVLARQQLQAVQGA
eukprot:3625833-Alexandrium_andersonii.AAC.1